jgi:phenylacetic acid degradation operon negative regulatory protein
VKRKALRDELAWIGFGRIAAGVLAHPTIDAESVAAILAEHRAEPHVLVMNATHDDAGGSGALADAIRSAWDLARLERDYRTFLERFLPILGALEQRRGSELDPEQCFLVRTLLIHEYRRVILRDPLLPGSLLPPQWPGSAARQLCRDLYQVTHRQTEQHLVATLQTPDGPLPQAAPYFYARFGGLT